jgi:hypothetical protein
LTAQGVSLTSPYDYSGAITAFGSSASQFYVWTEFDSVYGSHSVDMKLFRPNGTYYGVVAQAIPNANTQGYAYWSWYHLYADWGIAGYDIANTPGTWTVQLFVDGNYQETISLVMCYQFVQHLMAQNVQSSAPFNPIGPQNVFKQTDPQAFTWGSLNNV